MKNVMEFGGKNTVILHQWKNEGGYSYSDVFDFTNLTDAEAWAKTCQHDLTNFIDQDCDAVCVELQGYNGDIISEYWVRKGETK